MKRVVVFLLLIASSYALAKSERGRIREELAAEAWVVLTKGAHSGDMMARAMALDARLLFLDEPTSGLDPGSADAFDELVQRLKNWLGLTIVMISHDLESLWAVADRVAVLGDRRIVAVGSMEELAGVDHPAVQEYFRGERARRARRG